MNINKLCALSQGWTIRWNYRFSYRKQARLINAAKVPFWVDSDGHEKARVVDYNPQAINRDFVELLAGSLISPPTHLRDAKEFRVATCELIARRHLEWQQSQQGEECPYQDGIES